MKKTKWKIRCLVVSRSNQDEISKLNIAPQLAETIIIDRNSKKYTQNNVNQNLLIKKTYVKETFQFFH